MAKRREPVNREERIGPTPETLAKLVPDQVKAMFDAGQLAIEHTNAATEIKSVYLAVVGSLFTRASDPAQLGQGRGVLTDAIATAHAERYKPWAKEMGSALPAIIDALIDGVSCQPALLVYALGNYAVRMGGARSRHTIAVDGRVERQ